MRRWFARVWRWVENYSTVTTLWGLFGSTMVTLIVSVVGDLEWWQLTLLGLAVFTLVLAVAGTWFANQPTAQRMFRQVTAQTETTPSPTALPQATIDELRQTYIKDRQFRLVDVPRTDTPEGPIILGKTFENCQIEGPAVVAVDRGCVFTGNTFAAEGDDPEDDEDDE